MKRTLASLVIGLPLLMGASSGAYEVDSNERIQTAQRANYSAILQKGSPKAGKEKKPWRCVVLGQDGRVPNKHPSGRWYMPIPAQNYEVEWTRQAWLYEIGWFLHPQNYKEAVKLYRSAAERGHALAQTSLGAMYATGKGVPKDFQKAHKWFTLAMLNYKKEASKGSDIGSKPMTTAEISKVKTVARECIAKNFEGC
jgi:hypothetical protein